MKPPTAIVLILIAISLYLASRPRQRPEPMPRVYSNSFVVVSNWLEIATNRLPYADFHGTPAPE